MYKVCNNCRKNKELEEFHRQFNGILGRISICKECRKDKQNNTTFIRKTIIKCNLCKIEKKYTDFYVNNSSKTGRQSYCKECHKKKISESKSKLENYCKIIFDKFCNKNKDKIININYLDIINKYNDQKGLCAITNHRMEHFTDIKQRTDQIWNISIYISSNNNNSNSKNQIINYPDFKLVINLMYTIQNLYNLKHDQIIDIYEKS